MTGSALALMVGAALLHAGWNALAKRGHDPLAFLWCSVCLASLLLLPVALGELRARGFPAAALPYVAATIAIHTLYFYALGSAYRSGDFSVAYPIARGLGVALVPVLALLLFEERPSPLGWVGVSLVVCGILGLHLASGAWAQAAPRAGRFGPGTRWALVTGCTIAAYSLVDKAGVARLHPVPYIVCLGLGSMALLTPVVLSRRGALRREWAASRGWILAASTMNLTAYLLVLFAFRLAKVGYVVAGRELSIVLSALIGTFWLGEGPLVPRLLGAGVILAGVICVALAR